jgi:hypothetical protein
MCDLAQYKQAFLTLVNLFAFFLESVDCGVGGSICVTVANGRGYKGMDNGVVLESIPYSVSFLSID